MSKRKEPTPHEALVAEQAIEIVPPPQVDASMAARLKRANENHKRERREQEK